MLIRLAIKSLMSRRGAVLLTVMAMALSVMGLLSVEHLKHQVKKGFTQTVSGVDLIVGPRTTDINLLLYSIFHIGAPTHDISAQTYQALTTHPDVAWTVPIALGDSHRGFRVIGTTKDYFRRYHYGQKQALQWQQGRVFERTFEVVLGQTVAQTLGYQVGDKLLLSHGFGQHSFQQHERYAFTVSGILSSTATPVDQTVFASLQGIEAIHRSTPSKDIPLEASEVTMAVAAALLGVKSKAATFKVQRAVSRYQHEPLTAVLPGVALMTLWQTLANVEKGLSVMTVLVLVASLLGMSAMLLSASHARQQEMQLLRIIGASPWYLFGLIALEALLITSISLLIGLVLVLLGLHLAQTQLLAHLSINIAQLALTPMMLKMIVLLYGLTILASLLPAWRSYQQVKQG